MARKKNAPEKGALVISPLPLQVGRASVPATVLLALRESEKTSGRFQNRPDLSF